jgi:hypothetical protein
MPVRADKCPGWLDGQMDRHRSIQSGGQKTIQSLRQKTIQSRSSRKGESSRKSGWSGGSPNNFVQPAENIEKNNRLWEKLRRYVFELLSIS